MSDDAKIAANTAAIDQASLGETIAEGAQPAAMAASPSSLITPPPASRTTDTVLPEGVELSSKVIGDLQQRLAGDIRKHNSWADATMFNGGTVLILLLTALASLAPVVLPTDSLLWIAPVCSALAGILVAMERALGFGARWRYHREMRSAYESIIDMLHFYPLLPSTERGKYARDIFTSLYAVRSRESAIPNAGTNSQPT